MVSQDLDDHHQNGTYK